MRKFYTLVSTHKTPMGYEIQLDGKPVRTPAGATLSIPNEDIANLLLQEWQAQRETIKPDTMPLTQILSTKIDRVAANRSQMHELIMPYLDTDLVCYFTEEPPELAARQERLWRPALNFFEEKFGIPLKTTTALTALKQEQKVHDCVDAYIKALNDDLFTILQLTCNISGSLVLAIEFIEGAISAQDVLDSTYAEEDFNLIMYNLEKYGQDPESEAIRKSKEQDLNAAATYLKNL